MDTPLLLVEDDEAMALLLQQALQEAGYRVRREVDAEAAMRALAAERFALLLLDLQLAGGEGWDVCRFLRARDESMPLIIISAQSAEAERVLALERGADDYLVKPLSLPELVARVRARLRGAARRGQTLPPGSALCFGQQHRLLPERRELWQGARSVALTQREFQLLHFLASHPGRVFSRGDLLDQVWGSAFDGYEHTVNSHINRLRQKIEDDPQRPRLIETVWGVGYRFADVPVDTPVGAQ